MVTTYDALVILVFTVLPGVVAWRTWIHVGDLRPPTDAEARRGGVLIWCAVIGSVNIFNLHWLKTALNEMSTGDPTLKWFLVPGSLLLFPWGVGLLMGRLRGSARVQEWLMTMGFVSAQARTPWDNLTSPPTAYWVHFREESTWYKGVLVDSDTEASQLLLSHIRRREGRMWRPLEYDRVLLLEDRAPIWLADYENEDSPAGSTPPDGSAPKP